MCGGGGPSKPKKAEPIKQPEEEMLEARDDARKKMAAASAYSKSNKTKGQAGSAKLGGGAKLGSA